MLSFKNALLDEQIFLIQDGTKVANPPESVGDLTYSGSVRSGLFLLYKPEKNELPEPVQQMLKKLLKAIPGEREDVLCLNLSTATDEEIDTFLAENKPQLVICHHPLHTRFKPGFTWPSGCRVLPAPSLEQIHRDPQAKRSYWEEVIKLVPKS